MFILRMNCLLCWRIFCFYSVWRLGQRKLVDSNPWGHKELSMTVAEHVYVRLEETTELKPQRNWDEDWEVGREKVMVFIVLLSISHVCYLWDTFRYYNIHFCYITII